MHGRGERVYARGMADPIAELRDLDDPRLQAVLEVMCLAALADGELADEELHELAATIVGATAGRASNPDVEALLGAVQGELERSGQEAYLAQIAAKLGSPEACAAAVAAAVRVVAIDGVVRTAERELLFELAEGLGVDRDSVADLVRDLAR